MKDKILIWWHIITVRLTWFFRAKKVQIQSANTIKARPVFVSNPLMNWPRNNNCVCGSGKKFKKCCLNQLARQVTMEDAAMINNRLLNHGIRL